MKEKIINHIKKHSVTNFQDIFNIIVQEEQKENDKFNKNDLKNILAEIEQEGVIISAFNQIYDKEALPDHHGFVQWTMNGFCWVDKEEKSNSHGITFDIPDEAITIFNKKKALMGAYSEGKIIRFNEKDYYFWSHLDSIKKDIEFIYYVDGNKKCWQLNNGQKMSIPVVDASDEIYSVNTALLDCTTHTITHKKRLGLKSDSGIETKICYELGELKMAPSPAADLKISSHTISKSSPDTMADISSPHGIRHEMTADKTEIKDYTKKIFFTIDGRYTKDIDDAIAFEKTKTGYKKIVAIADVSRYVLPGSELDLHAKEAATSFYLTQKVVHMLSRQVAEKDGSLNPGELKTAMICEMNYDMEGNLKKYKFFPAKMMSYARLTYDDVNRMLSNEKPMESIFIDKKTSIKNSLISLNHYRHLKPVVRTSALYHRTEPVLGENGKVIALMEQTLATDADKIVEDAMLRANMCAAEHLYKHYPELGLFRNQAIPLDINRPKAATYAPLNDGHWGLGAQFYTHFTSPIRRYCDLVVHRMIKSTLEGKTRTYDQEVLADISKNINIQQNKSKQIQVKENHLLVQQYIEELFEQKKLGKTLTVTDITDNGIVTRNKQKIEYFIPSFKLSREIADKLVASKDSVLTHNNHCEAKPLDIIEKNSTQNSIDIIELSINNSDNNSCDTAKSQLIKDLNENYKILGFVDEYNWLDEKKNVSYFMQSKQQMIERQKLKDAQKAESKLEP